MSSLYMNIFREILFFKPVNTDLWIIQPQKAPYWKDEPILFLLIRGNLTKPSLVPNKKKNWAKKPQTFVFISLVEFPQKMPVIIIRNT